MGKNSQTDDADQMFAEVPSALELQVETEDNLYNTGKNGFEYYNTGGLNEFLAVRSRLRQMDTGNRITDADWQQLSAMKPPEFTGQVSPVQRQSMGHFKKKSLNRRLKKYKKTRDEWDSDQDKRLAWENKIDELEQKALAGAAQKQKEDEEEEERQYQKKLAWQCKLQGEKNQKHFARSEARFEELKQTVPGLKDIYQTDSLPADPDEMDKFYMANARDIESPVQKAEREMAKEDLSVLNPYEKTLISGYSVQQYASYNNDLRTGSQNGGAIALRNALYGCRISRDIVTRRGVFGVKSLAFMSGLANADSLTEAQIMQGIKDKMSRPGGLYITEKGFFSTSVGRTDFMADPIESDPTSTCGIEFIVLVKKGTCAANISSGSQLSGETEVLVNAGTRFKVIGAYFNNGEPGQDRPVFYGNKKSWKIYLETVPPNEKGLRNPDEEDS